MGIDLLDVTYRIQKRFGLERFRPTLQVPYPAWTAGDLFEQVWRGLQGEEPAWDHSDLPTDVPWHTSDQERASYEYLGSFHSGWRFFASADLERLIPAEKRREVWERLVAIWGVHPPSSLSFASSHGNEGESSQPTFPPKCKTTSDLIELFERAFWQERYDRIDRWRPSKDPPPWDASKWTREAAWKEFVAILCECLQVTPDEVTPDARLVKDLGLE